MELNKRIRMYKKRIQKVWIQKGENKQEERQKTHQKNRKGKIIRRDGRKNCIGNKRNKIIKEEEK